MPDARVNDTQTLVARALAVQPLVARPFVVRAYVGLGANLGDPEGTLAAAVAALDVAPGLRVRAVSPLYATRPVGPPGQPEYRNAVAAVEVRASGSPEEAAVGFLRTLKALEKKFGRKPRRRWAPREIDLDFLIFGRHALTVAQPPLTVPHPLAKERLFVLAPLRYLAPRLRPPGWHETVESAFRRQLSVEGPGAVRVVGAWDAAAGRWRIA
jgi:2-amino-4-hydroxy-6-hydroxymethyldihydropteridine diphosphokinase